MITTPFSFNARAQACCLSSDYFRWQFAVAVVQTLSCTNLAEHFSVLEEKMVEIIN